MDEITIDRVMLHEAAAVTELSFASKRHWCYPEHYYQLWKKELTITQSYIAANRVFGARLNNQLVGYYSLTTREKDVAFGGSVLKRGTWLEHMFVRPDYIGKGVGTNLFNHLRELCSDAGIAVLRILADPNARGFYHKMQCQYEADYPSSIPGRTTPMLLYRPYISGRRTSDPLR